MMQDHYPPPVADKLLAALIEYSLAASTESEGPGGPSPPAYAAEPSAGAIAVSERCGIATVGTIRFAPTVSEIGTTVHMHHR